MTEDYDAYDAWFDRVTSVFSLAFVLLAVFLPMVLIQRYASSLEAGMPAATTQGNTEAGKAEVAVGVAVILRLTARRLMRAGIRSTLQTTLGTFSRATSRAVTRRMVRVGAKSLALVAKDQVLGGDSEPTEEDEESDHPFVSAVVGCVALVASLAGILWLLGPEGTAHATGGLSLWEASLWAAAPLALYSVVVWQVARVVRVGVQFQTGLDGLVLQGYFTGAGSFLPLTTDTVYVGPISRTVWVAIAGLGSLLVAHLGMQALGMALDSASLRFGGAMCLVYAFVYSFPLRPLDGQYLWARSPWLWVACWLPILAAFVIDIPEAFDDLL